MVAGFAFKFERDTRHLLVLCLGRCFLNRCFLKQSSAFLLDLFDVSFGRERCELLRQQIVAGVTGLDLDDLAASADMLDVLA